MEHIKRVLGSHTRRVVAAMLLLLGVVTVVPMSAGLASAHHPDISGSASCAGVVSWSSAAWEGYADDPTTPDVDEFETSRSNPDISVSLQIVTGSGVAPATVHGQFSKANGYSFGGTFTWPAGALSVTVTATAEGSWMNGGGPGEARTSGTITQPSDCSGTPAVSTAQSCGGENPDSDGVVTFSFSNTSTDLFAGDVSFTIPAFNGSPATTFTVAKGTPPVTKTYSPIADGSYTVLITSNTAPTVQTQTFTVACDQAPRVTVSEKCVGFDGTVSVLLENLGDDADVAFLVNNVLYTVEPGDEATATVSGLGDGPFSISLTINSVPQPPLTGSVNCDPSFGVTAVCNTVNVSGGVSLYWYTVTNTHQVAMLVTWDGGSTTIPAGGQQNIASKTAPLSLKHAGVVVATAPAASVNCTRDVIFNKVLVGQPPTGETYTIRVSRLVGAEYATELEFDLLAGVPVTISLPSTLDSAGIQYKIEEIDDGSAVTSTVSPDQLKLSGHLGETISVVVTNGYASVQIIKASSTVTAVPGGLITYTLQGHNTGGLTLDPVVIFDRLPAQVSFNSVSVANNAGTCALAESTRPQLLVCTMHDALPVGGLTRLITLTVTVDSSVASGTSILNQAKVLGTYAHSQVSSLAVETDLSCLPAVAGTVCDLSAKVAVPVSEVGQEAPTTTTISRGRLPVTGASSTTPLLATAFGLAGLGGLLLASRRRVAR